MDFKQILILTLIVVVLLLLVSLVIYLIKGKKPKKETIEDYSEIKDLFGNNNILSIERTQKRVRIEVKELDLVNLEGLKPYTNGVFTIGNKVVVTFKDKTDQIVKSLKELVK